MIIDNDTALKPEYQQQQSSSLPATNSPIWVIKGLSFLRLAGWFGLWLTIILILYWPVLPALPFRDHPYIMLNHQLAENDWQWFWSMLSYNRTNVLRTGDYLNFRPLHFAIIALEDIFLRYNLFAQGVVNCLQIAFAASVFCLYAKRFVSTFTALALTFLWVSQPVGSTLVMWQHITPYILCPAFLIAALHILEGDDLVWTSRTRDMAAMMCVFVSTLFNDIGVATALSISVIAMTFGGRNAIRRRQILIIFFIPVAVTLSLNLFDYYILHPTPSVLPDANIEHSYMSVINQFVSYIGAIGAAFLAPSALHLDLLSGGFTNWKFYNESQILIIFMAVIVLALLLTTFIVTVLELRVNGLSRKALFRTLLLSFFLASFGVCAIRIYSRGISYMSDATYYYTFFSLVFCGLATSMLYSTRKSVINGVVMITLILGVINATILRSYFREAEDQRKLLNQVVTEGRKKLVENQGLCFNGFIPANIPYSPLFHDLSCANRPKAAPVYIDIREGYKVWLTSVLLINNSQLVEKQMPQPLQLSDHGGWAMSLDIPSGHFLQFSANKVGLLRIEFINHAGIQKGFIVRRNLLFKEDEGIKIDVNTLDNDPATTLNKYQVAFTQESILLLVNGRLIGELPPFSTESDSINIRLVTSGSEPADIRDMQISKHPSTSSLQMYHVFSLSNI